MKENKIIQAWKGFNKDLKCRDFQYSVGETYQHEGEVKACGSGFHACEHPLNVFSYYAPAVSRFCRVELSGAISREEDGDTKVASAVIKIGAEITIPELVSDAVKYVFDKAKWLKKSHTEKDGTAASATGYQGAASATGRYGAASATGDQGAASATGDQGAASATGYQGAASATGYQGAASATGDQGAAMSCGFRGKAMAAAGNAIFLVYRDEDDYSIVHAKAAIAGKDVKSDTWYTLDAEGNFVEVE